MPTAIKLPVHGYSGIEREAQYLAEALNRKGHEVKMYCSLDRDPDPVKYPWLRGAQNLISENDAFTYIDDLKAADVVHDFSHTKPLRMAKLENYLATTMWTDIPAHRNVFPGNAVAAAFGRPGAAVVPLGLPVDTYPTVEDAGDYYITAGRVAQYKGTDVSIGIAKAHGAKLCVAGHTGAFAEAYYAMTMKKLCSSVGVKFMENPTDNEMMGLMRSAKGLIHMHRWLESFSLVVAQALCLGVPVLTSNIGTPQELVAMVDGGAVSPLPADGAFTTEIAEAFMSREYTLDERRKIAEKARAFFDINRIADIYLGIYRGVQ